MLSRKGEGHGGALTPSREFVLWFRLCGSEAQRCPLPLPPPSVLMVARFRPAPAPGISLHAFRGSTHWRRTCSANKVGGGTNSLKSDPGYHTTISRQEGRQDDDVATQPRAMN